MAQRLPGLKVGLALDSVTFMRETQRVIDSTNRMGREIARQNTMLDRSFASVGTAIRGIGLSLVGLAAGVGIAGLVRIGKAALNTADQLADLSKQTGVSVESLQAFQRHAQLSGSSTEAMNSGLLTMTKGMGQLAAGTGRMASQLGKLDPVLRDQLKLATSQEQALRLVADALQRAGSEAQRQAIAIAVFGDAGKELGVAFSEGAAGVDRAIAAAQRMGVISTEAAAAAQKANDQLDILSQTLSVNVAQAFLTAAPQVQGFAFLLSELLISTRNFFTELNALGTQRLNFQIADLNEQLARVIEKREDLSAPFTWFSDQEISRLTEARDALIAQRDALVDAERQAQIGTLIWEKGAKSVSEFGSAAATAGDDLDKYADAIRRANSAAGEGLADVELAASNLGLEEDRKEIQARERAIVEAARAAEKAESDRAARTRRQYEELGRIAEQTAERANSARVQQQQTVERFNASLQDQLNLQRLQLQGVDRESEAYRIHVALLEAKRDINGELSAEQESMIRLLEEQATVIDRQHEAAERIDQAWAESADKIQDTDGEFVATMQRIFQK